jgi:hypothetical protein
MVDIDFTSGILDFKTQFHFQLHTLYFVEEIWHLRPGVSNVRSANSLYASRTIILH